MESGFGQNLEGFLIKGNLSLAPSANPLLQGDGSIEGAGTLYIDTIKEYNFSNGISIQDVLFSGNQIKVPYSLPSENLTSASVLLDGGLSIKHTRNATSISSGGALTIAGGTSIAKNLYVGGNIELNGNTIHDVAYPINQSDVANKQYVDDKRFTGNFTTGQVLIAQSDGDAITGFPNFTYDGTSLILSSTSNATGPTTGSFVCFGGISISKDLFVEGTINVNGNNIYNVATPIVGSDAVNKDYVDNLVDSNKIITNFSAGQILVGTSSGSIQGYNNFIYNDNRLLVDSIYIPNTTDALGLGSGGSLITLGGASFDKSVFIGGQLDVNLQRISSVHIPVESYDAVNKIYLDGLINSVSADMTQTLGDNLYEQSFVLDNNVLVPKDVPCFEFNANVKAFISYIYVTNDITSKSSIYTLRGNKGGGWNLAVSYVGDKPDVSFTIRIGVGNKGFVQYTNTNTSGVTGIKFRTVTQIIDQASSAQQNIALNNNTLTYQDIASLTYLNDSVDAVNIIIYLSNNLDESTSMFFLNCVQLSAGNWIIKSFYIGNYSNIHFNIVSENSTGRIQYINKNTTGSYVARVQQYKILKTQSSVIFNPGVTSFTNIPFNDFAFKAINSSFHLLIYVAVVEESKYALYEIYGYHNNGVWKINTAYIGDKTGIMFNIITTGDGTGILQYTNSSIYNAITRYTLNIPIPNTPLNVGLGGTGQTSLSQYTVLRGNNNDPIIGTNDFIYKDAILQLGNSSGILLLNTSEAINLTSATLVASGGVSINKNLLVGDSLVVKNIDITPSVGDIASEKVFFASNNQAIPSDVIGFDFSNVNVKSFCGIICVTVTTTTGDEYDTLYELKGVKKKTGWIIDGNSIGDNTNIQFSITNAGQIQYTSPNITDWDTTIMKFRALTTTYP